MSDFYFEDLAIWQRAVDVAQRLCNVADQFENRKRVRFAEQLRNAALSISRQSQITSILDEPNQQSRVQYAFRQRLLREATSDRETKGSTANYELAIHRQFDC